MPTDWSSPSTSTLGRISDARAAQFWDQDCLISHAMGEHDRRSVVWDYIAVYPPGSVWKGRPPEALFHGGPVVRAVEAAHASLSQALRAETESDRK